MWLIDTNIWLERLLDQQKSGEVALFLERIPSDRLWITDFFLPLNRCNPEQAWSARNIAGFRAGYVHGR